MSKDEIKKLNKLLDKKLREMSDSVSYEISSQNNELDVSEQINTQQMITGQYINTPLRQSQNTNTFDISNTQNQLQSLKDSELLKYSLATNTVTSQKLKGSNNSAQNQQKSQTQLQNHQRYQNPQALNIQNNQGIGNNKQGNQKNIHQQSGQRKEQTNSEENTNFRHEQGDPKKNVESKDQKIKSNNNNLNQQQNGLDESQRTENVRITENQSYLSTPEHEKLREDIISHGKNEGNYQFQGQKQLISSGEQSNHHFSQKQQNHPQDTKYIRVEDEQDKKSQNSDLAKQMILSKISQLSEEELTHVFEQLKSKKENKKIRDEERNLKQKERLINQERRTQEDKYNLREQNSDEKKQIEEDYKQDEQNDDLEDYQQTYEDIYHDISREQRDDNHAKIQQEFFNQQNRQNYQQNQNQEECYKSETEKTQPYTKLTTINQSNESIEDVLGINDLIHDSPHQISKQFSKNQQSSNLPLKKDSSEIRIKNDSDKINKYGRKDNEQVIPNIGNSHQQDINIPKQYQNQHQIQEQQENNLLKNDQLYQSDVLYQQN